MSEQDNPKPIQGNRFSFKQILVCLSPWLFYGACARVIGLDDAFYSTEGKEAIQKISELHEKKRIPIDTVKNAYYAHYAKGSFPANPNFHYRFDIDRQMLDSSIKKQKLKADTKGGSCFPEDSYRRNVGDWWQPSEVQSRACFRWNAKNTNYYMAFKDLDSKTARVYIFGYNN